MIQFAQIEYLALILVIPFLFLFYGLSRRVRRKRLEKFGERALVEKLIPDASRGRGWLKIALWSLALFFFAIGLSRPQLGARLKEVETTGVEIMIVLDVSNSMLAEDYTPNRLERAKLAISRLVDKMKQDRIGLIVFAGKSFVQLPITADYISAKIFLNSISTSSVPVQGTAMGDAILTAIRGFSLESANSRAVILITDGENHEDDPVQAATEAKNLGIPVFAIGIGTDEGKPIPAGNGELLKDKEGNIVVTKLDEKTLSEVVEAGGGAYVRAGNSDFGLEAIVDKIHDMDKQQYKSVVFEDFDEQYMYFFAIALFFLLLEFLVGERKGRNLFKSIRSGNMKKLTILLLILFSTNVLSAQKERWDIRRGNRSYEKGEYQKAEVKYRGALEKDSLSWKARYNLANVNFRNENPAAAEQEITRVLSDSTGTGIPVSDASKAFHNLGNYSVSQKKWSEAVEAYKNSLRINPADMETKSNLAYAQKMLKNEQDKNNQDQNQDQNQDKNQDQNKDKKKDQNQDKKDNDDQKDDQNKDQNKDQNQDQKQNQNQPPKITPQAAQQMLQAIQNKENETQEKVKREKAKLYERQQREKNW